MYFGVSNSEKATRDEIILYNNIGLISSESPENRRFRLPHCRLTLPLQGTPANLVLPETRVIGLHLRCWLYGSIFIQIFVVGSERRIYFETECEMAVQGHPTYKDFGTNRNSLMQLPIAQCASIVILVLSCPVSEILQVFCSEQRPPTPLRPNFGWEL